MSKNKTASEDSKAVRTEINLVFDNGKARAEWYHPKMARVLCALCGKKCTDVKCVNVNPYCG